MGLIESASQNPALRRVFLPLLKRVGFDVSIGHPWVPGLQVRLHSFRHKGYWFFGKGREQKSMELFAKLVPSGGTVVEVGGHIGYITGHFAATAGANGEVIVFEPGSNNLPYIRHNIEKMRHNPQLAKVTLVEKAVGPEGGVAEFFEDSLSGQNNSIVKDFQGLMNNAKNAFVSTDVVKRTVEVVSLDEFFDDRVIDFIKIDVEGFELSVLDGMSVIVERQQPIVMVEVQASENEILQYFSGRNYRLFSEDGEPIAHPDKMTGNVFALNAQKHQSQIKRLF